MRSRRKNTRSSSGRASRGDTGSWLHCWASQSRYFLCRSSMIRLLRGESGPWNWLGGAFCPNRLNLYRLIYHGRTWIGIPGQAPRSLSEYSPVLPHCPWVSLGLGLFGHGPRARRALSPPQLVAALQERRQIFRRLWVKQISCHSADTFSSPRNKNLRIPRGFDLTEYRFDDVLAC